MTAPFSLASPPLLSFRPSISPHIGSGKAKFSSHLKVKCGETVLYIELRFVVAEWRFLRVNRHILEYEE